MPDDQHDAAAAWAREILGPIRLHPLKVRPWGATWKVDHPDHPDGVYLKCSTARTGHEAALLQILTRICPELLPELLAADPARHRLIVGSAGQVLRERTVPGHVDLIAWCTLVEQFARLQCDLVSQDEDLADDLIAVGVPDERLDRYPDLLGALAEAPYLPTAERDRLRALAERWTTTEPVPHPLVPASVQHGDLHDSNVAVDAQGAYRFFDFGDASVAHPFTTMDIPLRLAHRNGLDPAGITRLEDAYLEVFTDLGDLEALRSELHQVLAVAPLLRAHAWLRALSADTPPQAPATWDREAARQWDHPIEYRLSLLT